MKIYRCQHCKYSVTVNKDRKGVHSAKYLMGKHYDEHHKDLIPPDMDGYRWFYFLLTKKSNGSCVICHNDTEFNRITMKYSRFCNNPQCKQKYKEERDKRMMSKYGKLHLLDDPAQQAKMQQNRRIAGIYTWSDGKNKFPYLSSYEADFLRHLDIDLNWPPADIMMPSPHTYTYQYNGKEHFYMPDAYLVSLNCEVEIKSSIRQEKQNPESREKEILKDQLMKSCSNLFNYIKIDDMNYEEFNKLIQKED